VYISYLNCEKGIRDLAFITLGAVSGMILFFIMIPDVELPVETALASYMLVTMGVMNALIVLAGIAIFAFLIILTISMCEVAYIYDNRAWGIVNTVNTRLDADKAEAERLEQIRRADIANRIKELKEL